jgi:hypothetical protein
VFAVITALWVLAITQVHRLAVGAHVCVSKIIDMKSAIPEQHRSGKQQNSPRGA